MYQIKSTVYSSFPTLSNDALPIIESKVSRFPEKKKTRFHQEKVESAGP